MNEKFLNGISFKEEMKEKQRKNKLAKKLLNKEIDVYDLSDSEVDEMTEYFDEDIKAKREELLRIKRHILKMKQDMDSKN